MSQPTKPHFPDRCEAVTPSDTTIVGPASIWVIGAGDIVVEPWVGGSTVTISVPSNTILPFRVKRVLATGTTATSIYAIR